MLGNKYRRTILRIRLEFNLEHYSFRAVCRILSLVDDICGNKGIPSLKRNTGHMDVNIRVAYKLVVLCAAKVAEIYTDGLLHRLTGIYGSTVFLFHPCLCIFQKTVHNLPKSHPS